MERKKQKDDDLFPLAKEMDYLESDTLLKDLQSQKKDDDDEREQEHKLKNEKMNILILFFLYVLQGIPLGLAGSIPMILQNHHVSYKQQALFSLVTWPFSIKLLWAPIVDSIHWHKVGRRKTWLIPTQYLIGLTMICLSHNVNKLLGTGDSEPNVLVLMLAFLFMNFLAATQDIAVDGWALTMLSRKNVGYASTCNSVGQTAGYFLGNVVFLALESANFCNSYLRFEPKPEGIVTLSSFLVFWGYVFLITTTMILILKKEEIDKDDTSLNIKETYQRLYRIMCLRNMWTMIIFLMTSKIGFAATDAASGLKLIEAGVLKEHLALLAVPMVPLQIVLPLLLSRYIVGPRPLMVFLKAYPIRLMFGLVIAILVRWTYAVKLESGGFPLYYYAVILIVYAMHQVTVYSIFVASLAFFAKVSDPAIGGTYMTLLNTLTNLGGNWPSTLALWWLDPLTSKVCENAAHLSCNTKDLAAACENVGGSCLTIVDGYYVETLFCVIFGLLWWIRWGKPAALRLQQLPISAWTY